MSTIQKIVTPRSPKFPDRHRVNLPIRDFLDPILQERRDMPTGHFREFPVPVHRGLTDHDGVLICRDLDVRFGHCTPTPCTPPVRSV